MLQQNVYTLGTAATTVVAPTVDAAHYVLKNLQPAPIMGELARKGHVYSISQSTSISNNGSVYFSFTTGASGAQFEHWEFSSSTSSVLASLIEGATITTTGSAIPAHNLNRNESDAHDSVLIGASALTGGTTILSQYVGASNQTTGGVVTSIPVTLEPNTQYGFKFQDVGGQGTSLHIQLEWAEQYNGYNDIWLDTVDDSFVLHGGEEVQAYLQPYQIINATAGSEGCRLAVMRAS